MSKKPVYFGLAYSALVIIFKLFILLGGYSLTYFGWYYSNITAVLLVIPFYVLAIRSVRENDLGGVIAGREALRVALTVFAVSAIVLSIYNYFEFENSGKQLAIEYYNSEQFLDFLKRQSRIKAEDYPKIIQEQIRNSEVSGFKATTGKLFSFMLIGISTAVMCAAMMKKSAKQ